MGVLAMDDLSAQYHALQAEHDRLIEQHRPIFRMWHDERCKVNELLDKIATLERENRYLSDMLAQERAKNADPT